MTPPDADLFILQQIPAPPGKLRLVPGRMLRTVLLRLQSAGLLSVQPVWRDGAEQGMSVCLTASGAARRAALDGGPP